jgi:hypothetical protein
MSNMPVIQASHISASTLKAFTDYANVSVSAGKKLIKVVDGLYADGIRPEQMVAPKKGEDRALYDSMARAIVAGFSTNAQKMIAVGAKDLPELDEAKAKANRDTPCKGNVKYWQQQIGSKMKDVRNALERRISAGGSDGAEASKSTWEATKRKELATMIAQAQKKEAAQINDMAAFIKDLQSALARISPNA